MMTPGEELDANIERQRKRDQAAMQEGSQIQETKRLEERLAERDAACGPMCASSVLQTQWQKIQRQARLLEMASSSLDDVIGQAHTLSVSPEGQTLNERADVERASAVMRAIDEERDKP